ncbi:hypothetical protein [Streptomyces sp. NPDC000994]
MNSILHIAYITHSSRQESGSGLRGWPALFDLVDEALELGDLVLQGAVAGRGQGEPGAGALALVALLDVDQSGLLQDGQVLAEVSSREAEGRAQKAELDPARSSNRAPTDAEL